ncbi:MAG: arginine repressor [Clostridiales bacterium]|nr:MAG: arginine repressor [Clostridiales bacterium]
MKTQRQNKILEIIENNDVETQEQLAELLCKEGFVATQATVSRDIKELRLVKISSVGKDGKQGRSKYSQNSVKNEIDTRFTEKFKSILSEMVLRISYAGHMVVLKTYPGMAQAACAAIDSLDISDIIGSLAGDDTIFIVMSTENDAMDFVKKLSKSISR